MSVSHQTQAGKSKSCQASSTLPLTQLPDGRQDFSSPLYRVGCVVGRYLSVGSAQKLVRTLTWPEVDWNKVSEDIGFPPPAVAKAYRTWSDAENVYEKDRVESAIPAFDAYKSLLDKLQRNSSDVDSLTIEELDRALEQKKVDLKGTQTEIAALEEELEIKKEMKGVERRLAAEREKIGKEMREIRKKAEEKVREKKRKLQEVVEIEDDKATASIKKEKI